MNSGPRNSRPLPLEDEVFVKLLRAATAVSQEAEKLLKSHGLSPEQYNVLRILRGAEPLGLACREIGERMITRDPDMTRLLDRLEGRGLVTRERQKDDRRVVKTRITSTGLEILGRLDQPVRDLHKRQFLHMPPTRLKALAGLLEETLARAPE